MGSETATWSHDELQDVCLNESQDTPASSPLPVGNRPRVLKNVFHECLFIAVIAFSAASSVFLQRSLVVIVPEIDKVLNMNAAEVAWSSAATGLTTGAFLIPFGHLADVCPVISRKTLLLLSLTSFSLLVAFTSFSTSGTIVDIMSGLAGIACAANIPIAVGILSLIYPVSSKRKNIVFSSFLMGNPAATIIGGLSSGALASAVSWKAPFIWLGILYAFITILGWLVIPGSCEPPNDEKFEVQRLDTPESFVLPYRKPSGLRAAARLFDWTGLFLLFTGMLLFTVALTVGPEGSPPWKTPVVILLLTLGLLFFGCFVLWEYFTKTPMIPPVIWENWTLTLIFIVTLSCTVAFFSSMFWISLFLQEIQNYAPFDVAVRLLPQALMGLFFSPLVGLFMHQVPGTVLLAIAGTCSVVSNIILVFLHQDSDYFAFIFPSLLLSTVGMDWTMNVGSLYIVNALPLKHHSIGASILQTTRLGIPLGLAVTTAVYNKGNEIQPVVPYTRVFIATTAFASFALILTPFIRIGKQGNPRKDRAHRQSERPSKRWSVMNDSDTKSTMSPSTGERPGRSFSLLTAGASARRDGSPKPHISKRSPRYAPAEKVVWFVCEQCGTSSRQKGDPVRDSAKYFNGVECGTPRRQKTDTVVDPARYFDDIEYAVPQKHNHDMIVNGRRRFPLVKQASMSV